MGRRATAEEAIAATHEVIRKIAKHGDRMGQATAAHHFQRLVQNHQKTAVEKKDIGTFKDYVSRMKDDYLFSETGFHDKLCETLQKVADGEITRLMVFAPPRHGKSLTVSELFPSYYLGTYPKRWVGMSSRDNGHALRLSTRARGYFRVSEGKPVDADRFAASEWHTGGSGGLWAVGIRAGISGVGFDLGIVDDPYGSAQQASSLKYNSEVREWWKQDFMNRADKDDSAIVIVQTRWTEQDLSGWLLHREDEQPENWHILIFPAIKESVPYIFPKTCTIIDDGREDGEPLFPERRSLKALETIRRNRDAFTWLALFQQRPQEEAGKGRICKSFEVDKNLMPVPPFILGEGKGEGETILVGMDFNVDPMSLCFARKAGNQIQVMETLQIEDSNTTEACREIRERYPNNPIVVYPDPTGKHRSTSSGTHTDFAIIERDFKFEIRAPNAAPPQRDRFNEMNRACGEQGFPPLLYLNEEGCEEGVLSLRKYTFKPGTSEPNKGGKPDYSHMFDAISFIVHEELPIESDDEEVNPIWL